MRIVEQYKGEANSQASELISLLGDNRPRRSEMESYMPLVYSMPNNETHGLLHTMNTLVVADSLFSIQKEEEIKANGVLEVFTDENREVVRLAALYHDSQHSGVKNDFIHGEKAADWMLQNLKGGLVTKAAELVRKHVPQDNPKTMTELLRVLKDADSLERVRAGVGEDWGLDVSYLRLPVAYKFIEPLKQVNEIAREIQQNDYLVNGIMISHDAFVMVGWMQES